MLQRTNLGEWSLLKRHLFNFPGQIVPTCRSVDFARSSGMGMGKQARGLAVVQASYYSRKNKLPLVPGCSSLYSPLFALICSGQTLRRWTHKGELESRFCYFHNL